MKKNKINRAMKKRYKYNRIFNLKLKQIKKSVHSGYNLYLRVSCLKITKTTETLQIRNFNKCDLDINLNILV